MASSKQGDSNAGRREVTAGNQSGNKAGGNKQSGDTSSRGFASMDPARQREIAAQGGRAAHQKGTAHEFTPEEARRAGSMSHKNSQSARTATATGTGSQGATGSQAGAASQGAQSSQQASQQGGSQPQGEQNNQ
jgi:uncharacterized protein